MKRPDSMFCGATALQRRYFGKSGLTVVWTCLLLGGFAATVRADVKLDGIFTSGAVLQQGMKIPIYGTADDGEQVSVRIQDQEASTVAVNGKWQVEIGPLKGGPQQHQLTVTGNRRLTLHNVLIGEVWVCAGGLNMQSTILQSPGFGAVIGGASNQSLRFFSITREGASAPQESTSRAFWMASGAASVGTFSAVGYHFGREIQKHTNVPVGLISCNHFESTIEAWISRETLEKSDDLKHLLDVVPTSPNSPRNPAVLYNGMVHPITRFGVRGVLWYHGENSTNDAYDYRYALEKLIGDWRKSWNKPNLPFLMVQVAPYGPVAKSAAESRRAELRESQFVTWRKTPQTALITTIDCGDPYNMNPSQKQPVGERLAAAAEAMVYGKKIEYMGPMFLSAAIVRNEATLSFDHVGGGLKKKGDDLNGFYVAGADRIFREAKATIKGNQVVVSSDQVPVIEAVRYNWADSPSGNLLNAEDLPASPFRTDNYPTLSKSKVPQKDSSSGDSKPKPTTTDDSKSSPSGTSSSGTSPGRQTTPPAAKK